MVTVTDKVCIACGKELKNVPVATVFCQECRKKRRRELMDEATKEGLQYVAYCKKHGLH